MRYSVSSNGRSNNPVDGIALLIVGWTIGDVTGTATDVARRAADGRWRYVIDNPFGTG